MEGDVIPCNFDETTLANVFAFHDTLEQISNRTKNVAFYEVLVQSEFLELFLIKNDGATT